MALPRPSIFKVLSAASEARTLAAVDLGFGRSAAIWRNSHDLVIYDRPHGHTISLYLAGGTGTRRLDGQARSGWPGALCLLPQGHVSEWEINEPFEFVHLYLPDSEMRRLYAEMFDRDARAVDFPELTFAESPQLADGLRRLALAVREERPLKAEGAMTEVFACLLSDPCCGLSRPIRIAGGLSTQARRRVLDFLESRLDGTIRLADLAKLAGLSEFHFQRMFRASLGVSPHVWLAHRRVEKAKELLRAGEPTAQIASFCGYSSQSHLTRAFKEGTGTTPAAYRRSL